MPQKRFCPEEIIAKLREAEVLLGRGTRDDGMAGVLTQRLRTSGAHPRTGSRTIIGSGPTNGVRSSGDDS